MSPVPHCRKPHSNRAREYHNFVDLPPDQIREDYPDTEFFDHWDPTVRNPVNIHTYPVLTDDDPPVENQVFTGDGVRVRRREGTPLSWGEDCGMMLNLRTLPVLFDRAVAVPTAANGQGPEEYSAPRGLDLYPQAFLGDVGHYQSQELPTVFRDVLHRVNSRVGDPEIVDSPELGPVIGGSCQGYNSAFHRIRYNVSSHDVQLAEQTADAARIFAHSTSEKAKASSLSQKLHAHKRAFHRLERKLSSPNVNTSLRLENVYHLDLGAVDDEMRNATSVYSHDCLSIYPLTQSGFSQGHLPPCHLSPRLCLGLAAGIFGIEGSSGHIPSKG